MRTESAPEDAWRIWLGLRAALRGTAAGTVPLMNYPTIVRHRPLRDVEHCILYAPEPGALARAVRSALADKQRLLDMARAAQGMSASIIRCKHAPNML